MVNAIKDGLQRAAQAGRTRARTGNAVPLLFVLLGAQKHYICLCARRTQRIAPDEAPAELDTDWDDVCRLCGRAGELICCDGAGCPRAYHPKCVGLGEDGAEAGNPGSTPKAGELVEVERSRQGILLLVSHPCLR